MAMTDAFFSAVGFVGICSMEYKRDLRDGKFYMVEPTVCRTDYHEEVAVLNGVNLPLSLYCGELGMPMPANPRGRGRVPGAIRSAMPKRGRRERPIPRRRFHQALRFATHIGAPTIRCPMSH